MERKAECCCGRISIEVNGIPTLQVVCHCENCKKRTGSAFGISAIFFESQVLKKTGSTNVYENKNVKNKFHDTHFCSKCGTTLFWYSKPTDDFVFISGGCFTIPLPEPGFSYMDEEKCSWVSLSNNIKTNLSDSDIPKEPA